MKTDRKKSFLLSLSLSVVTGVLLSFSIPPSVMWQTAFFAMAPLLASAKEDSPGNFFLGVISGFVFYAAALSWLYNVAGKIYLLLALYLSIYWGVFLYLVFALPGRGRIFTAAFIWVLLEIIVSGLLTGFPWMLLGITQWQNAYLLKIAGLFGIYGISFLIVLGNMTVSHLFRKRHAVSIFVAILVFAGGFLLPGEVVYGRIKKTGVLKVLLVQPNIDASVEEKPDITLKTVESVTFEKRWDEKPDIVIWPEGSFPENIYEYPEVFESLKSLSGEKDVHLLMGAFTGTDNVVYNSALLVRGENVQVYRKNHLVPYGEFILGGRYRIIRDIYESIAEYIPVTTAGRGLIVFNVNGDKRIAPLICYENVFPEISGQYVRAGSELFIVITNDSWFGRSAGPYQHFAHNVVRAAETGRCFVQCSLSGVSGVVSPYGNIESNISERGEKIFVKGVLSEEVPLVKGETFYSQAGNVTLFVLAVIFMGVILCRQKR